MRKSEKETVIRWDSAARLVRIDSFHPHVWLRLDRAGYAPVRSSPLAGGEVFRRYEVPLDRFRFRAVPADRPRRRAPRTAFRSKSPDKKPGT